MAHSRMAKIFVSNDGTVESENENVVDSYNALDHIKDMINDEMHYSFAHFMDTILPDLDSFIGAMKSIKRYRDDETLAFKEALKKV